MNLRPDFYVYRDVEIVKVVDGDTVDVRLSVDIGFRMKLVQERVRLRLAGINAPEKVGESRLMGDESAEWLRSRLTAEPDIRIVTAQEDKYGRRLALLAPLALLPMPISDLVIDRTIPVPWEGTINAEMVRAGRALEYWP